MVKKEKEMGKKLEQIPLFLPKPNEGVLFECMQGECQEER